MERAVERGPGGVLSRRQPRLDLLERERVVAEQRRVLLDVGERGLRRLLVAVDRRALAVADDAVMPQLDLEHLLLVARLARDHERLGEAQGHDPGGQLHGSTLTLRSCNGVLHHITSTRAPEPQGKGEIQ